MPQKLSPEAEEHKREYIKRYDKDNYDTIKLRVPKGMREEWKDIAARKGLSMRAFIIESVEKNS